MDTSSPWSRAGAPSVTLPLLLLAPAPPPRTAATCRPPVPRFKESSRSPKGLANRSWLWVDPGAAFGYRGLGCHRVNSHVRGSAQNAMRPEAQPSTAAPASMPRRQPQFSAADAATAKASLMPRIRCFGAARKAKAAIRVEGNLNMPVDSASRSIAHWRWTNALVPAVPADVASAARRLHSRRHST